MDILHDLKQQKFYAIVEGLESHLEYIKTDSTMNIIHTFVPFELRGRGIAAEMTKAALNFSKANNLKIIPSCSYAEAFIQLHKEYGFLVAE